MKFNPKRRPADARQHGRLRPPAPLRKRAPLLSAQPFRSWHKPPEAHPPGRAWALIDGCVRCHAVPGARGLGWASKAAAPAVAR